MDDQEACKEGVTVQSAQLSHAKETDALKPPGRNSKDIYKAYHRSGDLPLSQAIMDFSSFSGSEQAAMQQIIEKKQMKDFMKLYTGLVERCFDSCCNDFTSKALSTKEVSRRSFIVAR
ncbi:probable tim9-translocase of the mitochondrial inner membrane [Ceraceosorus bombacis]|uniref:Mitochondrial import inner membrane translocase subunit n=1 Tax=Ceraceosorus bombacis TaxID=401625 RepID=A0A0N7LAW7_9BASI|nr:probable tim9-translocase of the mitochondrial inner membrane [Ceraceosorus bombacis]